MELLKEGLHNVSQGVDLIGVFIVLLGFAKGLVAWLRAELGRRSQEDFWRDIRRLRCSLGTYLLLGLELMVVSDIVNSFLDASLDSLIELGAIVALRTTIGYFLGKELEQLEGSK